MSFGTRKRSKYIGFEFQGLKNIGNTTVFESQGSKNHILTRVYKVFGARGLKNFAIFKVSDLRMFKRTFGRSRSGERIRRVFVPGNVHRKTRTPMVQRRQTRVAQQPSGTSSYIFTVNAPIPGDGIGGWRKCAPGMCRCAQVCCSEGFEVCNGERDSDVLLDT